MKNSKLLLQILAGSALILLVCGIISYLFWSFYKNMYVNNFTRPDVTFPLGLVWQKDMGDSSYDLPFYQNGLVLMPINDNQESFWYGINSANGEIVWQQSIERYSYQRCLLEDYVVLASIKSPLSILQAQTGKIIWQGERADAADCSSDLVFLSRVPRETIQAAEIATGQIVWQQTKPIESFGWIIYDSMSESILATHGDKFYIIDSQTGIIKQSFDQAAPIFNDNRQGATVYLLEQNELIFGSGIVQNIQTGESIHLEGDIRFVNSPTIFGDTVYLATLTDGVIALDRSDYNIKWAYSTPKNETDSSSTYTLSSVVILNEIGYVLFSDATVRAFDLNTGQELGYWQPDKETLDNWPVCTYPSPRFGCDESARAGLTTSDDTLFVSFGDGRLYAFGN